jgi:hypothetical protein
VVEGCAELLADWGRSPRVVPLPPKGNHATGAQATTPAVGLALARRLRAEIEGSCALADGETYWRG